MAWLRLAGTLIFIGLLILGCTSETSPVPNQTSSNNTIVNSTNITQENETAQLTNETCQAAGGRWDECGSACRGAPSGTECIAMCVQYCECGASSQCPEGYICTDYLPKGAADAIGICKKT